MDLSPLGGVQRIALLPAGLEMLHVHFAILAPIADH
jgi:hypothetical protein